MKQEHKELIKVYLDKYLEDNNLSFKYEYSGYTGLRFFKNTKNEVINKYTKEEFLFKSKLNDFSAREYIYEFMKSLINSENNEEKELGYRFMIEKFPISNVVSYDEMYKAYIDILKNDKDKLFNFISRKTVLVHTLFRLEDIVIANNFTQEQCHTIIENCIQLKDFKTSYIESKVYSMACKILDNPEVYQDFFISMKQENVEKNFIVEEKEKQFFSVTINPSEIYQWENKLDINHIKQCIESFGKIKVLPSQLNIEDISVTEKVKNDISRYEILYIGENLNKQLLRDFTNLFLKEKLVSKFNINNTSGSSSSLAEQITSLAIAKNIEDKISQIEVKKTVNKKKI